MKPIYLFLGMAFLIGNASAICPPLEGHYGCVYANGQYEELEIAHLLQTDEIHEYRFQYSKTSDRFDRVLASEAGIRDDEGWVTRCSKEGRLRSVTLDGSRMSEMYLDPNDMLVRSDNDEIAMRCPRLGSSD